MTRNVLFGLVGASALCIGWLLAFAAILGDEKGTGHHPPPRIKAADIPPELFQRRVSLYEEKREAIDFIVAAPELIQQSLNEKEVLIYDQN